MDRIQIQAIQAPSDSVIGGYETEEQAGEVELLAAGVARISPPSA